MHAISLDDHRFAIHSPKEPHVGTMRGAGVQNLNNLAMDRIHEHALKVNARVKRIRAAMLIILAVILPCSVSGQIPAASAKYKSTVIREAHAKGGLNAPVAMFAGQLQQESSWNPNAHSGVGAQGLAQFMPPTAQWISKLYPADLPGAASLDPNWSIRALVFYDFWIYQRLPMYQTQDENRWAAALSGFNGGLGFSQKDAKLGPCSLWWGCADSVNDGRTAANLKQNRDYPFKIIRVFEPRYKVANW